MIVVTARSGDEADGCLVGFWSPASIEPPRLLVHLSKRNRTHRVARQTSTIVVHLLRRSDSALARGFGELTGDDTDKFTDIPWFAGPGGTPVIKGLDWCAGTIRTTFDGGDHTGFLLDVLPDVGSFDRADEDDFRTSDAESFEPGHPA